MRHLTPEAPPLFEDPAILATDVHMQRDGVPVLNGVTMSVPPHEFTLLTGHSGSGKSTFLKACAGIGELEQGHISVFGKPLSRMSASAAEAYRRENIAIGFQDAFLTRSTSVADDISNAALDRGIWLSDQELVNIARPFGMVDKLERQAGALSGGERIRASIMRTVVTKPALILLDEPTGALDARTEAVALAYFRKLVNLGHSTVFMVTHQPQNVAGLADGAYEMHAGKVAGYTRYDVTV